MKDTQSPLQLDSDESVLQTERRRRRFSGLHLIVGTLAFTVMAQTAFIGYLYWDLSRAVGSSLGEVSESPLIKQLSQLDLNGLGTLTLPPSASVPSTPAPGDPNRFHLPPDWDDDLLPDDSEPVPWPPFHGNDPMVDDLMGLFEQLDQALSEDLQQLDDPLFPGGGKSFGIGETAPRPAADIQFITLD